MSALIASHAPVFAPAMRAARSNAYGEHTGGHGAKLAAHALDRYALGAEETLRHKAVKIVVVGVLHLGLAAWLLNVDVAEPEIQAPIRLDVRTVEIPPTSAMKTTQTITEAPKALPAAPKPVPTAAKPAAPPPKQTSAPSLLQAPPDAAPAASDFSTPAAAPSPPATTGQTASASTTPAGSSAAAGPAGNAVISAARFDADYLRNPAPAYPPMSRRLREEGEVLLDVRVTADGRAEQVRIRRGSGYARLDEAALDTVQHWRFVPARRGSEPVAATVLVPIQFQLDR